VGANCGIDLANDDPVDTYIHVVNAYLQPFANKVWFLCYMQEVAAVVDSYRQQAAERRAPGPLFFQPCTLPTDSTIHSSATVLGLHRPVAPSSLCLSSAAVLPVLSLLTAGLLAAVLPVAVLPLAPSPSLLPPL
jgi:hypothetical protein